MQYLAQLFVNYDKFLTFPKSKDYWEFKEIFEHQEFLNSADSSTDFYSDLLITRTWILFLENKISPTTVDQFQKQKQFDQIITNLQTESYIKIKSDPLSEESYEEKEQFEYFFFPDLYFDTVTDFKLRYLEALDVNDFPINK